MKIRKTFIILILFSILTVMSLPVFATSSSNLPKNFNSNGDLTKSWYWLRDNSLQNYAQWTFENIPPGDNDLILEITALASDSPNGRKGLPAEFLLIYEVPGGNIFVTQKVTLPNDSFDYTCRGQVTIPRSVLHGASVLFVRAERVSPDTNQVAFKKGSIKIVEITGEEIFPPYQGTQLYQENQLPDTNSWDEAFLIQPGIYNGSLGEQITSGKRDKDDYYSINLQKGQIITLQLFMPSNANFKIYLYHPGSTSSVVRNTTKDNPKTIEHEATKSGLWRIKVHRSSGEGDYRLLISISGYQSGQTDQSQIVSSQEFTANKFYSNGDLFEGWYWLRDPTRQHYAEWTFKNIPPGNTDLTLEITVLATNQAGGGEGFSAKFRLIYGFPGSGSMGAVFQTAEITLPNVSPPSVTVGYTCQGVITIPRSFIPAATTIFLRVERISLNDNYVAFTSESINLFTGEQITGFREIKSEIQSTGTKK
jgi:predicted secreted protein